MADIIPINRRQASMPPEVEAYHYYFDLDEVDAAHAAINSLQKALAGLQSSLQTDRDFVERRLDQEYAKILNFQASS